MIKEELKQEAEEYALEKCKECYMCHSEENGERGYCPKLESRKEGYIAGAEPREKRIEELEKENKVLAQNLEDTEILNKTYEKRFSDLEKENAELKLKLEALEGQTPWKDIKDRSELIKENAELKADNSEWEKASGKWKNLYDSTNEQLTKAKELLERLLITSCNSDVLRVRVEAEQFLKDSEVEK